MCHMHGGGHYNGKGSLVYVRWRDKRTVTAMSVALPEHGEELVEQQVKAKYGLDAHNLLVERNLAPEVHDLDDLCGG